ncbi:MAG: gliding motility-associated C-terminal domain-containing protein, partial [Bacteroidota bacterium]
TTTYYRRVATYSGSSFNSNIITATVKALPTPTAGAVSSSICPGGTISLTSSGGSSYSWTGPDGFSSTQQNPSIPTATTAAGGTYNVTVTGANGCTAIASTTVTVNTLPTVSVSPTAVIIASGMSTTLTASGALSYSWSPSTGLSATNTATVIATPITTTAYIVTGTATTTGCVNIATVTVTVINPGVIGSNDAGCGTFTPTGLTSVSDASGASPITYEWQSSTTADFSSAVTTIAGATATTYSPGSISTTTYYRRVATYSGSSFNSNIITATVKALPTPTAGAVSSSICPGGTISLTSSGGSSYSWTGPDGFSSTQQNPSIPTITTAAGGTYTVTVIGANACTATASTTVTVNTLPNIVASPATTTIVMGGSVTLTASGASSYTWTPNTNLSSSVGAAVVASPLTTTTYTVTGTDANSCTNTTTAKVTVQTIDAVDDDYRSVVINGAKGGTTPVVLENDKLNNVKADISLLNLTLVSNGGINGLSFDATGALVIPANTFEGTYTATYSICEKVVPGNCDQANVLITISRGLALTATAICKNDVPYIQYTVTPNFIAGVNPVTLNWLNGDKTVVTAQATTSGLSLTGEILWPGAVLDNSGNATDWPGWLFTNGAWVQGADGFEKTRPDAYMVFSVNPTDTIRVSYPPATPACNAAPPATVIIPLTPGSIAVSQTICAGSTPNAFTSTSSATGGTGTITYQWQQSTDNINYADIPGATSITYGAGALTQTTYYRRGAKTTVDAVIYTTVVSVTVTAKPVVSILPTSITIQKGSASTLTASGADTYAWSSSAGLSSTTTAIVIANPVSSTTYTVTGTTGTCTNTANIVVTVIDPGTIAANQVNCGAFTPATITSATAASGTETITYQWQSSTTSSTTGFSNIISATTASYAPAAAITATTYYRRVATGSGQSYNSNVVTATVTAKPVVSILPTSITIQKGFTSTLTASGASTYAWSPSTGLSSATTATVIAGPISSTTYTVTGTTGSCTNTANIVVTVIDPGTIATSQVNCGAFTPATITSAADASGTGTIIYQWQSSTTSSTTGFTNIISATTASYTPSEAITTTTYYRRVATGAGKSYNSNVITATVNELPVITIAPTSVILAAGLTQTLTASGANTYVWSPSTGLSATNTAVVIASPVSTTTYSVVGTITASGCTSTGSVLLTVISPGTLAPGLIGSPQTICLAGTPDAFTSTAASGGLGTINYQWQVSTDSVNFTNITGATSATYGAGTLTQTTYYRRGASTPNDAVVYTPVVKVTVLPKPVIAGINGPCAMPRDTTRTFSVTGAINATHYVWTIPSTGGWSGSSTTNTIDVKAGTTNGTISVTPFNGSCAGEPVSYAVSIIDYARVTISGTPVTSSGNGNSPIKVTVQLIDILGNPIGCTGGTAMLCSNSGTFSPVVDNGDGTYTSFLSSSANDVIICGSVAGVPISKTTKVTFTGPQGRITSNGPILDFEIPKITFTATEGRAPFTVIYHSDKSPVGKNDTLTNVTSGTAYPVTLIPSTTLYTLVSVIDANKERRDNNFIRDTTTTLVLAPKVIITLKADVPIKEPDSTWATRIVVHTKNIGDLDLSNSQARLNLRTVFPLPVTYVLDSVRVSGKTVVPNQNYDGISNEDLFARLNKGRRNLYNGSTTANALGMAELAAPDGSASIEMWNNASTGQAEDMNGLEVVDDGHSIYMFGPMSSLPIDGEASIILWLHVRPNGYTAPFVMQAVALGSGNTEGATALTTSLSNDNDDVNMHPEVTKSGDPLPAIINLFPTAVIGAALSAGTPVLQGNGTFNVTLSYKVKNYGNVNLKNVQLSHDLLKSIGLPSAFNVVGSVTSTGNLIPNPGFNGKSDTSMLLSANSMLGFNQESILSYVINITPNQLSSIYRLQAIASGYSEDILATVTDQSNDGTEPDSDNNNIPNEKLITTIIINLPVPPLVPANIGIKTGPATTVPAKGYCVSTAGVEIIPITANNGGLDTYQFQWQSSADNVTFKDIIGAESETYTTGTVTGSFYLRRGTISGSQIKYSNSVYIQIYAAPAVPVITGTGSMVVGKGNITLTAPLSAAYAWSTGATTRSIFVQDAGNYGLTITDANGCTATATAFAITALDPYKVADVQKTLSKAPVLQADGSFLLSFNIVVSNLRSEFLDSVRVNDDLSKVFHSYSTFSVVDIKASGSFFVNSSYDGKTQTNLLNDISILTGLSKDSVQITVKVFPNGFAGTLNNVATITARSPFGKLTAVSNDPVNNRDAIVRLPTKFVIPEVDIFIPTGYSPNRDGINDNFIIIRPNNTTISLEIFNRWSNLVYKSADYKNEWAGKGNLGNRALGDDLPDGTYYYVVLATDKVTGLVRKFAGVVTLKR